MHSALLCNHKTKSTMKTIAIHPSINSSDRNEFNDYNYLTEEADFQMTCGLIPNLKEVCYNLLDTFNQENSSFTALQFIPVLQKLEAIDSHQIELFLKNPQSFA